VGREYAPQERSQRLEIGIGGLGGGRRGLGAPSSDEILEAEKPRLGENRPIQGVIAESSEAVGAN